MKKNVFLAFALASALFLSCSTGDTTYVVASADSLAKKYFPVTVTQFKRIDSAGFFSYPDFSVTLGFLEGKEDIPYIVLSENNLAMTQLSMLYEKWRSFKISNITAATTSVTITNEKTNTKATIDLTARTCKFDNYDAFFQTSEVYENAAYPLTDYLQFYDNFYSSRASLLSSAVPYSNIAGQSVTLDWSTQDIGAVLANVDGNYYLAMPLQSYADIFNSQLVYNGKYLFFASDLINGKGLDDYYSTSTIQPGPRSAALAEFCYNELCMNLDFNYGLKAMHGIESFRDFDSYFAAAGLRDNLKSTDALTFAKALMDVCEFYFGDGHSNYIHNSPYLGKAAAVPRVHVGSALETQLLNKEYRAARNTRFPPEQIDPSDSKKTADAIPAYEEIFTDETNKTVIVRFDHFTQSSKNTKAEQAADVNTLLANTNEVFTKYVNRYENAYETMALISAVNKKIKDHDAAQADANKKIKNVVLDLSCNGGGANHAAAFAIAWMLGYCKFDFRNPITGAKCSAVYKADVNFDGNFDANDTVSDKKLFCLISPNSFSCGNMVPAVLKASNSVTILGTPSSGGTSCVQSSSAADGTIIRFSSKNVMCTVKNGSYYDIDKGVEPHVYINSPANFYNLTELQAVVKKVNSKQ